jgi:hypothetical protein
MLAVPQRFLLFDSVQLWYPSTGEEVLPFLAQAPVITVMQCNDAVAGSLAPFTFHRAPFDNTLIDLSLTEKELWARLGRTSCRQEISKSKRFNYSIAVNSGDEDREEALRLVNHFYKAKKFRRPISPEEWRRLLEIGDLFVVKHEQRIVAAHIVVAHGSLRARPMVIATVDRRTHPDRTAVGPLNRTLYWHEFAYYRQRGVRYYDFGGLILDRTDPRYSVAAFKLSFGGNVIKENILRLSGDAALRFLLRGLAAAKRLANRAATRLAHA